jgi:hypothetical protein
VWLEICLGPGRKFMIVGDCGAFTDAEEDADPSPPKFETELGAGLNVLATLSLYLLADLDRELKRRGSLAG